MKKRRVGRPSTLSKPIRRNITFEPHHLKLLDRYARTHGLQGHAAAIRHLIDAAFPPRVAQAPTEPNRGSSTPWVGK